MPHLPASSKTRTIVAGKCVRGTVSHDAGNGGSSGSRWCVISMRVIVLIGNFDGSASRGESFEEIITLRDRARS